MSCATVQRKTDSQQRNGFPCSGTRWLCERFEARNAPARGCCHDEEQHCKPDFHSCKRYTESRPVSRLFLWSWKWLGAARHHQANFLNWLGECCVSELDEAMTTPRPIKQHGKAQKRRCLGVGNRPVDRTITLAVLHQPGISADHRRNRSLRRCCHSSVGGLYCFLSVGQETNLINEQLRDKRLCARAGFSLGCQTLRPDIAILLVHAPGTKGCHHRRTDGKGSFNRLVPI